jgi:hypothetical protein
MEKILDILSCFNKNIVSILAINGCFLLLFVTSLSLVKIFSGFIIMIFGIILGVLVTLVVVYSVKTISSGKTIPMKLVNGLIVTYGILGIGFLIMKIGNVPKIDLFFKEYTIDDFDALITVSGFFFTIVGTYIALVQKAHNSD